MPTYADYLSPAIRYSELLTNVTRVKIYDAVYCTHALCSISFSPRALTNVAKLMTPAFPLLFVQHLERIIRIIKFNRHVISGLCTRSRICLLDFYSSASIGRDVYWDSEKRLDPRLDLWSNFYRILGYRLLD